MGAGNFAGPEGRRVNAHEIIVDGWDKAGAEMAVTLRRKLGSAAMIEKLRSLGLGQAPGTCALHPEVDDATWGEAISINEQRVTVTLDQVARFLRGATTGSSYAPRYLRAAMPDAVRRGSAKSIAKMRGSLGLSDVRPTRRCFKDFARK